MNTLHFKYAVEVEKTGSISQAAENLFMAQPNLSKAIKELEDTLGISIFERTSKGVVATEQGREFLEYAKQILVQLSKMESIYVTPDEKFNRQSIKLSMPRSSYISIGLSNFIKELDLAKEIDIHIVSLSVMIDGTVYTDSGLDNIEFITMMENSMALP
ncbi:MAG: LysR family transcriptional regulator [Oscillospiraceae bacterium]